MNKEQVLIYNFDKLAEQFKKKEFERVIIDDELYFWNSKNKKFYVNPKGKYQVIYKMIYTYSLSIECELIDR